MFQRTGSGILLMKPWTLSNIWGLERRQSRRSLARASAGARTLARTGAKAGLATSPLALVLEIAEASVRAAHVEAVWFVSFSQGQE